MSLPRLKMKPSRAKVGLIYRRYIDLDYLSWKILPWPKYMDIWYPLKRTATGSCQACIEGGLKRYYGYEPNIVIKCLNCGHEQKCKEIYGWIHGKMPLSPRWWKQLMSDQ